MGSKVPLCDTSAKTKPLSRSRRRGARGTSISAHLNCQQRKGEKRFKCGRSWRDCPAFKYATPGRVTASQYAKSAVETGMFLTTSRQDVREVARKHVASLDFSHDVVKRSNSSVSTAVSSTRWLMSLLLLRELRLSIVCRQSPAPRLGLAVWPLRIQRSQPAVFCRLQSDVCTYARAGFVSWSYGPRDARAQRSLAII